MNSRRHWKRLFLSVIWGPETEKVNEIWQLKVIMGKVTHGEVETSETNLTKEASEKHSRSTKILVSETTTRFAFVFIRFIGKIRHF